MKNELTPVDLNEYLAHNKRDPIFIPVFILEDIPVCQVLDNVMDRHRQLYLASTLERFGALNPRVAIYEDQARFLEIEFGSDDARQIWEGVAIKVLTAPDERVKHIGEKVEIKTSLLDEIAGMKIEYFPIPINFDGRNTIKRGWPIYRIETKEGEYYIPDDINLLYYLAANEFLRTGKLDGLDLRDYSLVFSFAAEMILNDAPAYLPAFIERIAGRNGNYQGLEIAAVILNDIKRIYFPKRDRNVGTPDQKQLLSRIKRTLQIEYADRAYAERTPIIDSDLRNRSIMRLRKEGFSACFEDIFRGTRAVEVTEEIAREERGKPIGIIAQRAINVGKEEAIMIPLVAEMSGYGQDIVDIETWMQILWTIIREIDSTIDLHQLTGSGTTTLPKEMGSADAIEISLAALFDMFKRMSSQYITNPRLTQAMAAMGESVYHGDLTKRNLCWDRTNHAFDWNQYDFQRYEDATMQIAKIFSWFSRFAFRETGFRIEIGEAFGRIMDNIGFLRVFLNDIEDISQEIKGKFGNDVGLGATAPWAVLHRILSKSDEYAYLKVVENVFDNIGRKRRNFEALTEEDNAQIQKVVEIGRKYLSRIAVECIARISHYYQEAHQLLEEAKDFLPKDASGTVDKRNQFCLGVLGAYLKYIWKQIQEYKEYKYKVVFEEPKVSCNWGR